MTMPSDGLHRWSWLANFNGDSISEEEASQNRIRYRESIETCNLPEEEKDILRKRYDETYGKTN